MLTRKHFQTLAKALQGQKPNPAHVTSAPHDNEAFKACEAQWTLDCRAIASVCARENPAFDRAKFLRACGIEA